MRPIPEPREGAAWIYVFVDPRMNIVRYVGVTSQLKIRWEAHFSKAELSGDNYRAHWLSSLVAEGLEPRKIVLQECGNTLEDRERAEQYWIAHYRRLYGNLLTNSTDGGAGRLGMRHSEASRKKMSASRTGKKLSPEHRATLSRVRKGHAVSAETREKQRIGNLGKVISSEHREALRAARLREYATRTPEEAAAHNAQLASARKSIDQSNPETRKKISEAHKARIAGLSPEEARARLEKLNAPKRGRKSGGTSRYLGVCRVTKSGRWMVTFRNGRKSVYGGIFDTEEEAARRRDALVKELGLAVVLNFPEKC